MSELPCGPVSERRRTSRRPVEVGCQAVTDYDFFLLGDEIVDLSTDGLLLRSDGTPALIGEVVLISFRPPESDQWIDAEATVVRLVTGQTPGAPGIGLRLGPLPPFEQGLLSASLELTERQRAPESTLVRVRRRHTPDDVVVRHVLAIGPRESHHPDGIARVIVVS